MSDRTTRLIASLALGVALLALVLAGVAVFGTRELALPSTLLHAQVVLQHAGSLVAALAVASILSHYPSRLPEMGGWRVWAVAGLFLLWTLADAGGRPVLRQTTDTAQWDIRTAGLPAGTYWLQVQAGGRLLGIGKVVVF